MVALEKQMPVLGVCRGLQFIAHYFGASLLEIDGHVGVEHDIRLDSFVGKHHCRVNSFHRLGIDGSHLPSCLKAEAWDSDGYVEMLSHRENPVMGIMWHPERSDDLSSLDHQIISRCFNETA